jgi:S-DNA-T family DNA segregation ATPase FtsK/SpoIIIE
MSSPLAPVLPFLAQAREVGFHMVVAQRGSGGRGMAVGGVLGRILDIGTDGLVLSGDPREGATLGGVRPGPQPPGRGVLVRRGHPPVLIQAAADPADLSEVN